jgi:hypothetical protein
MITGNNWLFFVYTQSCFLTRQYLLECFTETFFDTISIKDSEEIDLNNIGKINILDHNVYELNESHENIKPKVLWSYVPNQSDEMIYELENCKLGRIYYLNQNFLNNHSPTGFYGVIGTSRIIDSNTQDKNIDLMLLVSTKEDMQDKTYKLFDFPEIIPLQKNMIINYKDVEAIQTSIGRFLLNRALLVEPFGDKIPYANDAPMNLGKIEDQIAQFALHEIDPKNTNRTYASDITDNEHFVVQHIKKYKDNLYFIGHFGELAVASFTEKSLTIDPKITQLKYDLLEKHKNQLNDKNVLINIEQQLIKADKERLKDDVSSSFFIEDKNWNVARKKLFLTTGLVETLSNDPTAYAFIPNSLTEGWGPKEMPAVLNEVRKGIYGRALTTADTGTIAKFLLRIFQNTIIKTQDCKSKTGLTFILTPELVSYFIKRYIITPTGLDLLTEQNKDNYLNKSITVRSPMYCKASPGLCKICTGQIIDQLHLESIGVLTLEVTEPLFKSSMKAMHGKSHKNETITDITQYLV